VIVRPYDPRADLEQRGDISYLEDDGLPRGDGWWLSWLRLVVVRESLHPTHKRCVVAHELAHADHDDVQLAGHGPEGARLARRQENRADREAAGKLVDFSHLVAALTMHPGDPRAVAHELEVTGDVLRTRLENLSDEESATICTLLADIEHAA
jgi:Zn-dependent peptidase ImmA (M78 family)